MTQDPGSGSPMSERMQSLLSRAVEDQLSEQRQLAGALTEFRAQIARLGGQLEALRGPSTPAGSSTVEEGIAGLSADVREAVRLLAERVDGVTRMVQQRGHDLAEVRASVVELKQSVEEHTKALSGVTGGLSALPAFGERIGSLQDGLTGLHDRLQGLEQLSAAVTGLQHQAEVVDGGLRDLRHAFTGVAARAAELPARTDMDAMFGRLGETVENVGNRLGRVESALPSLLERLDGLDATLTGHGDRLREVHELLDEQADEVPVDGVGPPAGAAIESALASLGDRLDDLRDRTGLEDLTQRIDELHEALFGEDGLRAAVRTLAEPVSDDPEPEPVDDVVARAVEDSERRLAAHIDQAVLALAEALLRRRAARSTTRAELLTFANAPVTPGPVPAEPATDQGDENAGHGAGDDEGEPAATTEEPAAKRKPWWRPGD